MKNIFKNAVTYGLYPVLLAAVITVAAAAMTYRWNYQATYVGLTLFLVVTLVTIERIFPLSEKWAMTGKSFLRDLKYIAIDAPTIALTKTAFGMGAIYYSETHQGIFTTSPLLVGVIGFLLVFEFFQYWFHRFCHEGKGKIGRFFWRAHLAHHLPNKVYVVMHAVFNPINVFITTAIIQTPLILLGISPEATLAATLVIDLQSLVSHFNVNLRVGFLNYLFIGTETHRFHHSAKVDEAKNYGNTLVVWDIIFGTFYRNPGTVPENLGMQQPNEYPDSNAALKVIAFPFKT